MDLTVQIRYRTRAGEGQLTIYPVEFFPATKGRMKKLKQIIDLSTHETDSALAAFRLGIAEAALLDKNKTKTRAERLKMNREVIDQWENEEAQRS